MAQNKKKICLITNWYPSENNKEQGLFFREQIIALSDYYDFYVLHYQYGDFTILEDVNVDLVKKEFNIEEYNIRLNQSLLTLFRRVLTKLNKNIFDPIINIQNSIIKHLNNKKFNEVLKDVDLYYTVSCQTEANILKGISAFYNKPYVISEHAPFPWVGSIITKENKEAIENANLFLAISNDKIKQIKMQNVKLKNIKYVGNLVDENVFTYKNNNNDIKTFITVGANSFYKNYDMLIKTLDRLCEISDKNFRLIVVGYDANKGYSRPSEELIEKFKKSKFSDYIDYVPSVPHEEMNVYYNKADAFIMTSIQEGQPVSALEAACSGLPIFSTRCGGVEDYVDDKVGRLVDVMDFEKLAYYLKEFLENEISFDNEYIRKVVIEKYGKKEFVKNMHEAFESVMRK